MVAGEHELEEVRGAGSEGVDLDLGRGVQDSEAGVDVPFVGVDAKHDVDLDGFDATDVLALFPGI